VREPPIAGRTRVSRVAEKERLCYDGSPSAAPNPAWEAGTPSGAVTMSDVLAVPAQVGLSCIEPP